MNVILVDLRFNRLELPAMSTPGKSNRRDFLSGRSAQQRLADVAAGTAPEVGDGDAEASLKSAKTYLVQVARKAMACDFAVLMNAGQYEQGQEAAMAALDLVDELEDQFSVYRDSSEIMHVNRTAGHAPVTVDRRLFELLELCQELSERTDGAFDATSAPLNKAWGFHRRQGCIPDADALEAALRRVGFAHLKLDNNAGSVAFAQADLELDFGGIGKGYALDLAAEQLEAAGVTNFLMHGGRSSVVARGTQAGESGWSVGIRDPLRAGKRLGQVMLQDAALSTSGAGSQFFRHEGRRYSHIIDPRSGRSVEGLLSTTVISPSAAEADALSTAFYVMGPEEATRYCENNAHLSAVLVTPGGDVGGMSLRVIGKAADCFIPERDATGT